MCSKEINDVTYDNGFYLWMFTRSVKNLHNTIYVDQADKFLCRGWKSYFQTFWKTKIDAILKSNKVYGAFLYSLIACYSFNYSSHHKRLYKIDNGLTLVYISLIHFVYSIDIIYIFCLILFVVMIEFLWKHCIWNSSTQLIGCSCDSNTKDMTYQT